MLVPLYQTAWHHIPEAIIFIDTGVRTSNLANLKIEKIYTLLCWYAINKMGTSIGYCQRAFYEGRPASK
jgi:hypothetical protein